MKTPSARQLLPVLVAVLAGLSLGAGHVRIAERTELEAGPAGWQVNTPNIPVLLARLAGPPNRPGDGWPLASHAALVAPGSRVQAVEVAATLPENGHLEVVFEGSGAQAGVALQLDRGRSPYAIVTTAAALSLDASHPTSDWAALDCDGTLPTPTTERVRAGLTRETDAIRVSLAVGDAPASEVRCAWGRPTSGASLRSGLRRIGIRSLSLTQQGRPEVRLGAPGPAYGRRALWGLIAAFVLGGLATVLRFVDRVAVRGAPLVVSMAPLLLVWPLSGADLVAGLQAVRVVADAPLMAAVAVPLALSALLVALFSMARTGRAEGALPRLVQVGLGAALGLAAIPAYGPVGAVAVVPGAVAGVGLGWLGARLGGRGWGPVPAMVIGAAVFGGCVAVAAPRYGMATTYAATMGMAVAGVIWANVQRPRGFNLLSLGLMCLAIFFADQGLRWTDTGARVTGRSARARPGAVEDAKEAINGTFSSFEALENTRSWSDYPFQDYPVEPAPRRTGATRVVALGGSSTGGAWQNDDLGQFWPAELERRHGSGLQAVNQGVGGWTTLHIRRFLETRLADVDPDVVVLYVGHNDIVTESVRPYGELFEAWKQGTDLTVSVSGVVADVPLYQLARFGLQGAFGSAVQPAVPVRDARANLETIIGLLAPREIPLILAREGIAPDPSVLDRYGEMLAAVAASADRVEFVDTSAALTGPGAGEVFLDNCHLTERGHVRVAEAVRETLVAQGWVGRSGR